LSSVECAEMAWHSTNCRRLKADRMNNTCEDSVFVCRRQPSFLCPSGTGLIEKSDYTEGIKAQAGRFHSYKRGEFAFLGFITKKGRKGEN
jgi:hypothetical protein